MRTRALFAAVMTSGLLIGCAPGLISSMPHACNMAVCNITISVAGDRVIVDPEIVLVVKNNRDVQLHWHLAPGLEFSGSGDGVAFKGPTQDQFYGGRVTENKKSYHWRDRNTVSGEFHYSVTFHDSAGRLYFKDPTIMNES